MAFSCEQQKVKPSDPIQWEIKKRPSSSTAQFKVPKGLTPKNTSGTAGATTTKMSHASWETDDPLEHNWLEDDSPLEDFVQPPSSYVDDRHHRLRRWRTSRCCGRTANTNQQTGAQETKVAAVWRFYTTTARTWRWQNDF